MVYVSPSSIIFQNLKLKYFNINEKSLKKLKYFKLSKNRRENKGLKYLSFEQREKAMTMLSCIALYRVKEILAFFFFKFNDTPGCVIEIPSFIFDPVNY